MQCETTHNRIRKTFVVGISFWLKNMPSKQQGSVVISLHQNHLFFTAVVSSCMHAYQHNENNFNDSQAGSKSTLVVIVLRTSVYVLHAPSSPVASIERLSITKLQVNSVHYFTHLYGMSVTSSLFVLCPPDYNLTTV